MNKIIQFCCSNIKIIKTTQFKDKIIKTKKQLTVNSNGSFLDEKLNVQLERCYNDNNVQI